MMGMDRAQSLTKTCSPGRSPRSPAAFPKRQLHARQPCSTESTTLEFTNRNVQAETKNSEN
jgi:hypothetical protein